MLYYFFLFFLFKIGVDFALKKVKIPEDDVVVNSMLWDTSGNKGYEMVTLGHFRNSDGALLVFDITNPNSFFNLDKWLDELRKVVDENWIIWLVPNKSDLIKDNQSARAVSEGQIRDYVRHNGLLYFGEISCKEEANVKNWIENLIKEIYFKKKCEDELRPPKHSKFELMLRKEKEQSENSKFKWST